MPSQKAIPLLPITISYILLFVLTGAVSHENRGLGGADFLPIVFEWIRNHENFFGTYLDREKPRRALRRASKDRLKEGILNSRHLN